MGLTAATYLGDNTIPILNGLVAHLRTGAVDVVVADVGRSSADARSGAGAVDLVWACGCLTASMLDRGELNHEIVGAPVFSGSHTAAYTSVVIAKRNGPTELDTTALGLTLAVNEPDSWSGHHGLRAHLAASGISGWFAHEVVTGSHRASVEAVAAGRCDMASIDVTVWNHLAAHDPALVSDVAVVAETDPWPSPPFSVRRALDEPTRSDLQSALLSVRPGDVPGLDRIAPATAATYAPMRR